jgi:hypothetical protein
MMVQCMRASDGRYSKQKSQSKRQCRNNKLHEHVSTWYAKHLQCKESWIDPNAPRRPCDDRIVE